VVKPKCFPYYTFTDKRSVEEQGTGEFMVSNFVKSKPHPATFCNGKEGYRAVFGFKKWARKGQRPNYVERNRNGQYSLAVSLPDAGQLLRGHWQL